MAGLRLITPQEIPLKARTALNAEALQGATQIVEDVKSGGEAQVLAHAIRLGDLKPGESLFVTAEELRQAFEGLPLDQQAVLKRSVDRVRQFAQAQRQSLVECATPLPGGACGHKVMPVESAGCYVPGGRYPLPSSLIMTAVSAQAAGVKQVWVASPRPSPATLAAAHVVGVAGMLRIGGAQAIAALTFGTTRSPACDIIVGPGNSWVTAAKFLVSAYTKIDMLAGPSELVVLADSSANPSVIAADLLAQAEHDAEALPILVTPDRNLAEQVNLELDRQLDSLSTRLTAALALKNGFSVLVKDLNEGIATCNALAPEHLEVQCQDADSVSAGLNTYGGLFIGSGSAEVFGDYCTGPNHVLPTGGTARSRGGLSVFDFLAVRTWLRIDSADGAKQLREDAVTLARMEGLEGHARSAEKRSNPK